MSEQRPNNILVIEGEGGAGKTTTAQLLAVRYGLSNFNTGTLFRATAANILYENIPVGEIADLADEAVYQIDTSDALNPQVAVNGLDVSALLQLPEVTRVASIVGQVASASAKLEKMFYDRLKKGDMVVEGKSLANKIGVQATHLSYLTANPQIRAYRKWNQAQQQGRSDYTIRQSMIDICINDSRDRNLLAVPANTTIIDTGALTPLEVVSRIASESGLE